MTTETGEKAAALFEYLTKLIELRSRPIRDISDYDEHIWFADLPDEPEVSSALGLVDGVDEWLSIRRPRGQERPVLPPELMGWIDQSTLQDPNAAPTLLEEASDEDGVHIAPDTRIRTAWSRYLVAWTSWAEERRRVEPVFDLYQSLFDIQQRSVSLGEQYETVVGLGLLFAQSSTGQVRRHLVSARCRIAYEASTGRIALVPDADGIEPAIETDMLDASMTAPAQVTAAIRSGLSDLGTSLLDPVRMEPLLTTWINSVSAVGRFEASVVPPSGRPAIEPWLVFAPALILRRRTQRSLIAFYQSLISAFRSGVEPPPLVRGLVEILEADDLKASLPEGELIETYFPLQANEEQLHIVERLRTSRGLAVVGPPGTGKSHTIANLVSDALAHGRRVVVTSHTARALEVLVEKLPEDIRDLCVIMAGEGRGLSVELRRSVVALLNRSTSPDWTLDKVADRIASTSTQLAKVDEERVKVLSQRRRLRESASELIAVPFGGYEGTLARIAQQLSSESTRLGWIPDDITDEVPITGNQAQSWLGLERRFTSEVIADAERLSLAEGAIPDPQEFRHLVDERVDVESTLARAKELTSHPSWNVLHGSTAESRSALRAGLTQLRRARDQVTDEHESWIGEAIDDVLAGREQPWIARAATLTDVIHTLDEVARTADSVVVSGLESFDLRAARRPVEALRAHLAEGKGFGIGPFRAKVVRDSEALLKTVRVDGEPPRSAPLLDALATVISSRIALDDLRRSWGDRILGVDGTIHLALGHLRETDERVWPILALQSPLESARAAAMDVDDLVIADWADRGHLRDLEDALGAVDATRRIEEIAAHQRGLLELCQPHQAVGEIALIESAISAWDANGYASAYVALRDRWRLSADLAERNALFGHVKEAAPQLAAAVRDQSMADEWTQWFEEFEPSWLHARVVEWVRGQTQGGLANELDSQLARLDIRQRQYVGQLGSLRAWDFALRRLTQRHKAHLVAYKMAMVKYGKGQGKYAATYLAQARAELQECIDAVPAWVMPTYRLADTLPPFLEPFDLAIVDEASQSGVEELFIWALAKQVIVVGDSEQISPDAVGINLDEVHRLQAQLIPDIPFKDRFEPSVSIFDQALLRYPGQLQLREHFRCMPEIIEFSNRLCYASSPLHPVRQFGTDRLEPLMAVHVEGAEEKDGVNKVEAMAVVDKIVECCSDPRYANATMGVISLTDDKQAKFIQRRLIERLGPDRMLKHRIKCGNAYAFQGDQRTVMFLSMVASPRPNGNRLPAQVNTPIRQRFNVAASRAEDQEWLFHSVTQNDLNPDCLRHQLLTHFIRPEAVAEPGNLDVTDHEPDDHFDSLFEQRVYRRIVERGYQVVPQFPVLGFRIDLVVNGGAASLAVECDGDEWHGPEQFERDTARQRDLERCGWTFVRVVESDFYLDPDDALGPLWTALDRLGIKPRAEVVATAPPDATETSTDAIPAVEATVPVDLTPLVLDPRTEADRPGTRTAFVVDREPPAEDEPSDLGLDFGGPSAGAAAEGLAPYRAFPGKSLPLLTVPSAAVEGAILEIVAAEGPVTVGRVRRIYMRCMGRSELTGAQKSALNRTVTKLTNDRRVAVEVALGAEIMADWALRPIGSPVVAPRKRGARALGEVPLSEITSVASTFAEESATPEETIDRVLEVYSVPAPSAQQRSYVRRALDPSWALRQSPVLGDVEAIEPATATEAREAARSTRDFDGVLDTVINEALALGTRRRAILGEAWNDDDKVEAVRLAFLDNLRSLGVASDLKTISSHIRDRLFGETGQTRGAIVDTVLARFLTQIADPSAVRLLLIPWKTATAHAVDALRPVVQGQCAHGEPWGSCKVLSCPGHFLGSVPADYDWRAG